MDKESGLGHLIAHGLLLGGGAYAAHRYAKKRRRDKDLRVPLEKVESSMIRELGYVPKSRSMYAKFNTGRRYKFKNVRRSEYKRLREADSIGTHFNKNIKNKYKYEKIAKFMPIAAGITGLGGAVIGGAMRDQQGNAGGVGGAISGAMMGAALPFAAKGIASGAKGLFKPKAPAPGPKAKKPKVKSSGSAQPTQQTTVVNQNNPLAPPTPHSTANTPPTVDLTKTNSYSGGIALMDGDLFEKTAFASTTMLAHTAAGAGMGALMAGEGNRVQGALFGAGAGAVGSMVGRAAMGARHTAGQKAKVQSKIVRQQKKLQNQLKNTPGMSARHDIIEAFVKNPNNAEFAQMYRSSMGGGLIGGVMAGGAAGMMNQNKTAAYRAVERLRSRNV